MHNVWACVYACMCMRKCVGVYAWGYSCVCARRCDCVCVCGRVCGRMLVCEGVRVRAFLACVVGRCFWFVLEEICVFL